MFSRFFHRICNCSAFGYDKKDKKDFLNLGPNCHLFQGYTSINKNTEIEILYQNILKLRDNKVISVKPEFRDLLKAEAIKNRYNKNTIYIINTSTKNCC